MTIFLQNLHHVLVKTALWWGLVRRRRALAVSCSVLMDACMLVGVCLLTVLVLDIPVTTRALHVGVPIRVVPVFFCLIAFRVYSMVWSRAHILNYIRLAAACLVGTMTGSAAFILFDHPHRHLLLFSVLYFTLLVLALSTIRLLPLLLREFLYSLERDRLADDPATSRIVVYGAGLRYKMFRRELMRSSSRNARVIVGLLDDDILLRGLRIGGQRVYGTLSQARRIIRELRADAVVITCVLTPERLAIARQVFAEAGVKVTLWQCEEVGAP